MVIQESVRLVEAYMTLRICRPGADFLKDGVGEFGVARYSERVPDLSGIQVVPRNVCRFRPEHMLRAFFILRSVLIWQKNCPRFMNLNR